MSERTKRVVSFSLWGSTPKYLVGAIENVKLAKEIYPGWTCQFWVSNKELDLNTPLNDYVADACMKHGAEIMLVPGDMALILPPMYWRFLIADEPDVEYFIIRDADSRLSLREKAAVDEWIESGKLIHSMRDHPAHCRAMNGGMWGAKGGALPNMVTSILGWLKKLDRPFAYSDDQDFLGRVIWMHFYNHALQHDSCCKYPDSKPFPTKRDGYRFVGEVFEADGTPRAGDWEQIVPNS